MSAGRICSRVVASAAPDEKVRAAAQRMAEHDVGTLVVLDPHGDNAPLGILTDRDIAVSCVAAGLDPDHVSVSKVMSEPVRSVDESTSVEETIKRMAQANARRLVVTGGEGRLVGIISLDDVLALITEEAAAVSRLLEQQAPRVPA